MYSTYYFCDLWRQFRRFFISNVSLLTWGCRFTIWYDIWQEKLVEEQRGLYEIHTHLLESCINVLLTSELSGGLKRRQRRNRTKKLFPAPDAFSKELRRSSWSALLLFTDGKMFRKERHAICVAFFLRFYFVYFVVLLFEYRGEAIISISDSPTLIWRW